jgi:hypothetical protein
MQQYANQIEIFQKAHNNFVKLYGTFRRYIITFRYTKIRYIEYYHIIKSNDNNE